MRTGKRKRMVQAALAEVMTLTADAFSTATRENAAAFDAARDAARAAFEASEATQPGEWDASGAAELWSGLGSLPEEWVILAAASEAPSVYKAQAKAYAKASAAYEAARDEAQALFLAARDEARALADGF